MSRVLLLGAFGQDNPGDDALADAFTRGLAGHERLVASARPAGVTRDVDDTGGVHMRTTRPLDLARALREVDAVAVAGGTVFKRLHPASGRHPLGLLTRTWLLRQVTRTRGIPLALVGVGTGDLDSRGAVRLARSLADTVDLLVLRDEESATILHQLGARGPFRVGADPAWTVMELPLWRTQHDPSVVIALSHLADTDGDRLAGRVAALVPPIAARGLRVELQPWQPGPDENLARAVEARVEDGAATVAARPRTLQEAVDRFADARAVVGLRHHSLVAAAAAGRPFLAVTHEPKLTALARRLDQRAVPAHAGPAVLARSATELLSQEPPAARAVRAEIDAAHRMLRLLRVVVSGGAEDELVDRDQLVLTSGGTPW